MGSAVAEPIFCVKSTWSKPRAVYTFPALALCWERALA